MLSKIAAIMIAATLLLGLGAFMPQKASAQVDEWRVLHVGLESTSASVDTDGDGRVNTWKDCKPKGNSGKQKCGTIYNSSKYSMWQTDMNCFKSTVEQWSDYQISIYQEQIFIETDAYLTGNYYDFAWNGYADQYGFENYDVVMVWTGYTQALGFDGGTWNGNVVGAGYSFIALYGLAGHCDMNAWPGIVPPHEFVHTVTGLYAGLGYPVCGTYEYTEGHHAILTNTHSPITCGSGVVSTGVPAEAWASGSWMDHYGGSVTASTTASESPSEAPSIAPSEEKTEEEGGWIARKLQEASDTALEKLQDIGGLIMPRPFIIRI
jgi:hypothetical protein